MSPELWERVTEVFETARTCAPEMRQRRLEQLCGADAVLRAEVEALLAAEPAADGFLSTPILIAPESEGAEAPGWPAGTRLAGRFEIVRWLGSGGMGEVYAARDLELGAEVALKRLRAARAADPQMQARFKREVLLARRVSHPNVCRIHDLASAGAVWFLSMELLQGETLAERLRPGRPALAQVQEWLAEIAAGLDAAHAAEVVHRDLKPGNVILHQPPGGGASRAVITDFGLARAWLGETTADSSASRSRLVGTLAYMAPEQLAGESATAASDIYAFGLIAYELLTGQAAFPGAGTLGGLLPRLQGPPAPPSTVAPELGRGWDALIAGCLAELPGARFATAAEAMASVHGAAAGPKPRPRRRVAHPGLRRGWVIAGVGLAALAVTLVAARFRFKQVMPEVPAGAEILLTPVVNATLDPELDGASVAFHQLLAQSGHFQLVSDAAIAQDFQRMTEPSSLGPAALAQQPALAREVAMREGAPLVVFSTLLRVGDQYRVGVEMERTGHDPDTPARTWTDAEIASTKPGLLAAVHRAANWVRRQSGESETELAATDLAARDITTPSWSALSLYERSEQQRASRQEGEAVALLQSAVQSDPRFALAYSRLGDELVDGERMAEGYADYRRALQLAAGSRRLSARERLRLSGSYDSDVEDFRGAVAAFATYNQLYPRDYLGWFYQGFPEMELGHPALALAAWNQAGRLAPNSVVVPFNTAVLEMFTSDLPAAERDATRLRALGASDAALEIVAGLDASRGQWAQAESAGDALMRLPPSQYTRFARGLQAAALAEQGRYAAALALLQRGLAPGSPALADQRARWQVATAYLDFRAHRPASAIRAARAALALTSVPSLVLQAGTILARSGDIAGAGSARARLQPDRDLHPLFDIADHRLRGEILLAQRLPRRALAEMQQAARLAPATDIPDYLARALAATGDAQAALTLLQPWTASPGHVWAEQEFHLPGRFADLVYQAALLSDRLRLPSARDRWQQYLQLRAGGDAGLPEVAYARQRLRAPSNNF